MYGHDWSDQDNTNSCHGNHNCVKVAWMKIKTAKRADKLAKQGAANISAEKVCTKMSFKFLTKLI